MVQFRLVYRSRNLAIFKRDNGAPNNACSNFAMFAQQIVRGGCRFTLFTAASHKLGSKTHTGATTPTKYTTGTILALPLQSGPCLLGSAAPRTAIVLPPAPMVNQVKETLLEFEHWFAQGGVASFTADLRSEFGGLDQKLRKNIFNSTMPTYARPEDGAARQVV